MPWSAPLRAIGKTTESKDRAISTSRESLGQPSQNKCISCQLLVAGINTTSVPASPRRGMQVVFSQIFVSEGLSANRFRYLYITEPRCGCVTSLERGEYQYPVTNQDGFTS